MNQVMHNVHTRLPANINPILHYALMPFSLVIVIFSTLMILPVFAYSMLLQAVRWTGSKLPGVTPLGNWLADLYHRPVRRLGNRVLKDPRDEPMLAAVISLAITTIPVFVAQLSLYEINYILVLAYYAAVYGPNMRGYVRSFSAMHLEGHRPGGILKGSSPYENLAGSTFFYSFLSMPMGLMPHSVAHAQQHHKEYTGPLDLYASALYDHANLWHYFRYMVRDLMHQQFMTTPFLYFWRKNKREQAWIMVKGNLVLIAVAGATAIYSPTIAFFYFFVPWGASNFLLGIIHWSQHSFYGGQYEPKNYMMNTVTVKETPINFLNEGLHLAHHHRAGVHWSESPALMEKIAPKMKAADSIVFKDFGYVELFLFLTVFRWWGMLADKLETWEPMTREEKIAHLKIRTKPAPEFLKPKHLAQLKAYEEMRAANQKSGDSTRENTAASPANLAVGA